MPDAARPVWLSLSEALDRIARITGAADRNSAARLFAEPYANNAQLATTGLPRWSDSLRRPIRQEEHGVIAAEIWRRILFGIAEIETDGEQTNIIFIERRFQLGRPITFTCRISEIQVRRADIEGLWPLPDARSGADLGTAAVVPVLNFMEPRDAVQFVRSALRCSGDDAVAFMCDRWRAGEVTPRFTGAEPPPGVDRASMADWFSGKVILPGKRLPRRAVDDWNDDPEWQEVPGQSFPFLIDRRQLEAAIARAGAATAGPITSIDDPLAEANMHVRTGGLPDDAIPFAQAIKLLAPIMGRHYPERDARRALAEGAADERLTGYARPDHAHHYDKLDASLWRWCKPVENGRGNYDLSCNHQGIVSGSRDIHFSRAEVERYREYRSVIRDAPGAPAAALSEAVAPSSRPPETPSASERRVSPAVQAMRNAYTRLVRDGEITTDTIGTARFQKVRDTQEVCVHQIEMSLVVPNRNVTVAGFGRRAGAEPSA